jgi:murein DD-endopeptidase MepM/ murein hydrolase activator NlpD
VRFLLPVTVLFSIVHCASVGRQTYALPFPSNETFVVLQGYNGPYGHTGKLEFAYDFKMPIGTNVAAARSGVVIKTESRYTDGNRKPGQENYIFISHQDNTFSRYYHLTRDGVLVSVGDRVSQGQAIGRSGDTGASAGPHLHFDVTRDCPEWGCQTIPIRFRNASENPLVKGQSYKAAR